MAKTKTFAEKMLKKLKPPEVYTYYKVIKPTISPKGTVRFVSKHIKVHKDENEAAKLGI